jgi:hypothetical protein
MRSAWLAGMFICAAQMAHADGLECLKECNADSIHCLLVQNKIPNADVKGGFSWLFGTLSSFKKQKIEPKDLQTAFKIDLDPCKRGATEIDSGGHVSNSGLDCLVGGKTQLPTGELESKIFVPQELKITYVKDGSFLRVVPDNIGLLGTDAANSKDFVLPTVIFSSDSLQQDWGGIVRQVWFNSEESILQTRINCIRFKY